MCVPSIPTRARGRVITFLTKMRSVENLIARVDSRAGIHTRELLEMIKHVVRLT